MKALVSMFYATKQRFNIVTPNRWTSWVIDGKMGLTTVMVKLLTIGNINNWGTFNSSFQPTSKSSDICVDTWVSWKGTTDTKWDDSIKFWVVTEWRHTDEWSTTEWTHWISEFLGQSVLHNSYDIISLTYLLGKHQLVLLYTLRINVDRLWC